MKKDDVITINIDGITEDGDGIGRVSGVFCAPNKLSDGSASNRGFVVFCRGTLPGETVRCKIIKVTSGYAVARPEEIIKPSPDRVVPDCKYYPACGGCSFRHVSYNAQLACKEQYVRDCIVRIGGFRNPPMSPIIGAKNPYNYRNKAVFPFGTSKDGQLICGFYRKNSHSLVETDGCLIENELASEIKNYTVEAARRLRLAAYDETQKRGLLRFLAFRTSYHEKTAAVVLSVNTRVSSKNEKIYTKLKTLCEEIAEKFAEVTSVFLNENTAPGNVIFGEKFVKVYGDDFLYDSILGARFQISPASFFQVNPEQTEILYSKVIEFAEIKGGEHIADIFCGIGTIGICLAAAAARNGTPVASLTGIEYVEDAVKNARDNASQNNVSSAEFFAGHAAEIFPTLDNASRFDAVIVDPPRKGCDAELIHSLTSVSPKKIIYVSCNPATLARDLKLFGEDGYFAEKIQPVEMFPFAGHVETVVLMSRADK